MGKQLETRCEVCGQPIHTMQGAMVLLKAHMVCRKCFGKQTYAKPVVHPEQMHVSAPPATLVSR